MFRTNKKFFPFTAAILLLLVSAAGNVQAQPTISSELTGISDHVYSEMHYSRTVMNGEIVTRAESNVTNFDRWIQQIGDTSETLPRHYHSSISRSRGNEQRGPSCPGSSAYSAVTAVTDNSSPFEPIIANFFYNIGATSRSRECQSPQNPSGGGYATVQQGPESQYRQLPWNRGLSIPSIGIRCRVDDKTFQYLYSAAGALEGNQWSISQRSVVVPIRARLHNAPVEKKYYTLRSSEFAITLGSELGQWSYTAGGTRNKTWTAYLGNNDAVVISDPFPAVGCWGFSVNLVGPAPRAAVRVEKRKKLQERRARTGQRTLRAVSAEPPAFQLTAARTTGLPVRPSSGVPVYDALFTQDYGLAMTGARNLGTYFWSTPAKRTSICSSVGAAASIPGCLEVLAEGTVSATPAPSPTPRP